MRWRKKQRVARQDREPLWPPGGPSVEVISWHLGDGDRQALSLNPWLVPPRLRDAYLDLAAAALPDPVSLEDAARIAWAPFSCWPGTDAWPDFIAAEPHVNQPSDFLGTDAYRQHVALVLAVTGWPVEQLVNAVSMTNGGLPLFAAEPSHK